MANSKREYSFINALIITFAALLLFFAETAYWLNHTVFNQIYFTNTVSNSLLSEQSRDVMSTVIVDKLFSDRPVLKSTLGPRTESLVSGILDTDLSKQVIDDISNKSYEYATTPNRDDVAIDLTPIKVPISAIVTIAENQGETVEIDSVKLPDQIVLIRKSNFPNLSGILATSLWVGPLLWFMSIGLFSLYVYLGRDKLIIRLYKVYLVVATVALAGILTGPYVPPALSATISTLQFRSLIEEVTSALLSTFVTQMYVLLSVSVILALLTSQRNIIFNSINLLNKKISKLFTPKN